MTGLSTFNEIIDKIREIFSFTYFVISYGLQEILNFIKCIMIKGSPGLCWYIDNPSLTFNIYLCGTSYETEKTNKTIKKVTERITRLPCFTNF